jgi:hypothetical protein
MGINEKTAITRVRFRTIEDIRRQLSRFRFNYIDLEQAVILYQVAAGCRGAVFVIGHPGDASYEWLVQHDPDFVPPNEEPLVTEHSDSGYGCSATALRDGLNHFLGS